MDLSLTCGHVSIGTHSMYVQFTQNTHVQTTQRRRTAEEPRETRYVSWNLVNSRVAVRNVAFEKARDRWTTLKITQGHWKRHDSVGHITLPICGLYEQRRYLAPFPRYPRLCSVRDRLCDLDNSFSVDTIVEIKEHVRFMIHIFEHIVVNTCYIYRVIIIIILYYAKTGSTQIQWTQTTKIQNNQLQSKINF